MLEKRSEKFVNYYSRVFAICVYVCVNLIGDLKYRKTHSLLMFCVIFMYWFKCLPIVKEKFTRIVATHTCQFEIIIIASTISLRVICHYQGRVDSVINEHCNLYRSSNMCDHIYRHKDNIKCELINTLLVLYVCAKTSTSLQLIKN